MLGFGRKKSTLPDPSTNTEPSSTQQYLSEAMGAPKVTVVPKKKKVNLDPGGQIYRGEERFA